MTKRERREQKEREREYRRAMKRHTRPITEHVCGITCKSVKGVHNREEIYDDFELSQKARETIDIDIIRSRGRDNKERTLIRQYQSTRDQSFVLRLSAVTGLRNEFLADMNFGDDRDACNEYYNYAVKTFEFTETVPVPETIGFFAELDAAADDSTWDTDDESSWDMEDDDEESSWDTDDDDEEFDW